MQFESPSEEEKQQTSCSLGVGILGTAAAALSSGAARAKLAPQLKASRGLCECTNTLLSPLLSANTNTHMCIQIQFQIQTKLAAQLKASGGL